MLRFAWQAWDAEHFAGDAAKSCSRLRAAYVFCKNAAPASAVPPKKSAKSCCGMFTNILCFQTFAFWGLIYNALVRRTSWIFGLPSRFPWQAWDAEHLAGDAAKSCSRLRAAFAFCKDAVEAYSCGEFINFVKEKHPFDGEPHEHGNAVVRCPPAQGPSPCSCHTSWPLLLHPVPPYFMKDRYKYYSLYGTFLVSIGPLPFNT